jgi:hypothetical protein
VTEQPPEQIGDANQGARSAAILALEKFKGEKVTRLTPIEQREILTALLQWLGLADENGKIK